MFEGKTSELEKFIAENKGKRKFKQSVELAVNFKDIDFSKQDNRMNLDIILPNGRGKVSRVAIFASDKNILEEARKIGVEAIDTSALAGLPNDRSKMQTLLSYDLLAQPNLMPTIARYLGQFLGPRDHMPKPLIGNLEKAAGEIGKHISIKSKGKFLPTAHCIVGMEDMETSKLIANMEEVINNIQAKVGQARIRSVYVKLTMSKPMRLF